VKGKGYTPLFVPSRNKLYEIACESWGQGDDEMRQKMSEMASAAAWGLGQWDHMEEYVHSVPNNTMVYSLFQSVLHIHRGQFAEAQLVCTCHSCGWSLGVNLPQRLGSLWSSGQSSYTSVAIIPYQAHPFHAHPLACNVAIIPYLTHPFLTLMCHAPWPVMWP
jgi:FKBP12-rapamycin complex-associated protein